MLRALADPANLKAISVNRDPAAGMLTPGIEVTCSMAVRKGAMEEASTSRSRSANGCIEGIYLTEMQP